MPKNKALARLTEDLLPLTDTGDWTKLPGKSEQYYYNEEPSIVISRRQFDKVRNYDKPLSEKGTRFFILYEFETLDKALRYASKQPQSARIYITCEGLINSRYDPNLAGAREWRTIQELVYRHSFKVENAESQAQVIFTQTFRASVGVQK